MALTSERSIAVEAMVSEGRIVDFLDAEELQDNSRTITDNGDLKKGDEVVSIKDGSFRWSETVSEPTLKGIDLAVKKGELLGVLGRVGDGKVSFDCTLSLL